jgi:hypothetical protein
MVEASVLLGHDITISRLLKIKALRSFETSVVEHTVLRLHTPEEMNPIKKNHKHINTHP